MLELVPYPADFATKPAQGRDAPLERLRAAGTEGGMT
jgi:hypothetical protein